MLTENNQVRRRKRSVNLSPDHRNFYGHEDLQQIETEIITMDHTEEHAEKHAEEHAEDHTDTGPLEKKKNPKRVYIDDIDSEDELILDYEADDLSEIEANRHRFNIEEKQDLIPYPKWWSVKKRNKKRNHHKR